MSKEKPNLQVKYLRVLTTANQREIIKRVIEKYQKELGVKEGRATELMAVEAETNLPISKQY